MKSYCEKCDKLVEYITKEEVVLETIKDKEITYLKKYDICSECQNIFYTENTYNQNIINSSNEIRKQTGIITTTQIEEILKKYNIGKKPLSLVLGWGEVTIIRYLDGQIPEKVYSDILLKILEDPKELLKYLELNKELITKVAYKKVIGRIAELKLEEDKSKIYLIAKHVIAKIEDITPLSLQKILYYIQGFSLALLNKEMFNNNCEAWVHGPVYREIYDRFCYYSYNPIERTEFSNYKEINLEQKDIELIDAVIDNFACYSGKILEKMTHTSLPWLMAREGLNDTDSSNKEINLKNIKDYFTEISLQYNIKSVEDIQNYSTSMFKEVNKR